MQGMAIETEIPISLKGRLVAADGQTYREFRAGLTPRWGIVWRDIANGYAVLLALLVALAAFAGPSVGGLVAAMIGGVLVGYVLEYLSNFFHEAAHYNVAPGRERNDRVTNVLFAWMFGKSIRSYRRIHFQHHRALGTTMDSENSYFDALGVRYLAAGLFGLKAVRTLRRYREIERDQEAKKAAPGQTAFARLAWMGLAVAVDLGVAAVLAFALGNPVAGVAWLWGILFMFPFFGSLRQLLEHRSDDADPAADYRRVDHGAVNRLFGDGPLASTLGSAGFNRHALHHWEPTVSYTRLADIECYLRRTDAAPLIEARSTSYAQTFLRLLEL